MRYLNECEFDIFGDLNMIVKCDFDFYDYDDYLCNGPHCATLSVVKIIFGILLKCAFVNEMNKNDKVNEIGLGTAVFNKIDTEVSAIDILVSIFGVVCCEYDIINEISFDMSYFYCFRIFSIVFLRLLMNLNHLDCYQDESMDVYFYNL